jgi:hypothetical protein
MNYTFEFVYATKFVLQIYNVNLYAELNLLYKWLWLKSYVQIHVHRGLALHVVHASGLCLQDQTTIREIQ